MKKILVVDDQLAMRNMFKKILVSDGFEVVLVEDGGGSLQSRSVDGL